MVLQLAESGLVELGVPEHHACRIDQRHAMPRGHPGRVGDGVGGGRVGPLRRQQSRLALQLLHLLLADA
jgi:hypothetical protein